MEIVSLISPSYYHGAKIKKTVINKLGKPFNDCVDDLSSVDTSVSREITGMGSDYRRSLCYRLCLLHFMERTCNCSLPNQLGLNGKDTCSPECLRPIVYSFDYDSNCLGCPVECDSVGYDLEKTPEKFFLEDIDEDVAMEVYKRINKSESSYQGTILDKIAMLDVYFESLSYVEISEMAKTTFPNLIANLGGTIGRSLLHYGLARFIKFYVYVLLKRCLPGDKRPKLCRAC